MNDWLSTEDAALQLELTPAMVRILIDRGQLGSWRLGAAGRGGRWLVSAADVVRLAAERAAAPPRRGPTPGSTPNRAALAKRRSRARLREEQH